MLFSTSLLVERLFLPASLFIMSVVGAHEAPQAATEPVEAYDNDNNADKNHVRDGWDDIYVDLLICLQVFDIDAAFKSVYSYVCGRDD